MPHRGYGYQYTPTYEQDGPHDQKALNQPLNHPFNLLVRSISPPLLKKPYREDLGNISECRLRLHLLRLPPFLSICM